jgi:hypothetical protein
MKIRFIEKYKTLYDKEPIYFIEERKWWGWKRLGEYQNMYGGVNFVLYQDKNKITLLLNVLYIKKKSLDFTRITEYPSLKIY